MRRNCIAVLLVMCLLLQPGCYDRINLEDIAIFLMLGLDLDDQGNLLVYLQSPVFTKTAKEKSEKMVVRANDLREAREKFDTIASGLALAGKLQVMLLGKRLVEQQDWFPYLDVFYRDAKQSISTRVVAVDGTLEELFAFEPKDKPPLFMHIKKLIDTANQKDLTVKTTLKELYRQMYEPGITPSISILKKDKQDLKLMGSALLNKRGGYAMSISPRESSLLAMLRDHTNGDISLTVPVGSIDDAGGKIKKTISFNVHQMKEKIRTNYAHNTFSFDIVMQIGVDVTSRNFEYEIRKHKKVVEQAIARDLKAELTRLIKQCQQKQLDPVGLGLHARAYQYQAWKKVESHWTQALAQATVNITPHVELKGVGLTR